MIFPLVVSIGSDCTDNSTLVDGVDFFPCPEHSWIGIVLLAGYMMISNVLLLNLLIAMFRSVRSKSSSALPLCNVLLYVHDFFIGIG